MPEESAARLRLRRELIRARDLAGLSGRAMVEKIGLTQGSVWRFEKGRQMLAMPRIRAWLDAAGVVGDERDRLLELAEAVHSETRPWRDLLDKDGHLQAMSAQRESQAVLVQNFQPTIFPGLLQTPEYESSPARRSAARTRSGCSGASPAPDSSIRPRGHCDGCEHVIVDVRDGRLVADHDPPARTEQVVLAV